MTRRIQFKRNKRIPTVYGEATGAEALKVVNHLIYELEKRYLLNVAIYNPRPIPGVKFYFKPDLIKKIERLKEEKKGIIEKIEVIRATITPYGLMGKSWNAKEY